MADVALRAATRERERENNKARAAAYLYIHKVVVLSIEARCIYIYYKKRLQRFYSPFTTTSTAATAAAVFANIVNTASARLKMNIKDRY